MDKKTNQLVTSSVEAEARMVMINMKNLLEAAGSGLDKRMFMKITRVI